MKKSFVNGLKIKGTMSVFLSVLGAVGVGEGIVASYNEVLGSDASDISQVQRWVMNIVARTDGVANSYIADPFCRNEGGKNVGLVEAVENEIPFEVDKNKSIATLRRGLILLTITARDYFGFATVNKNEKLSQDEENYKEFVELLTKYGVTDNFNTAKDGLFGQGFCDMMGKLGSLDMPKEINTLADIVRCVHLMVWGPDIWQKKEEDVVGAAICAGQGGEVGAAIRKRLEQTPGFKDRYYGSSIPSCSGGVLSQFMNNLLEEIDC